MFCSYSEDSLTGSSSGSTWCLRLTQRIGKIMSKRFALLASFIVCFVSLQTALAVTPKSPEIQGVLAELAKESKAKDPAFTEFSAERGKTFYFFEHTDSAEGDKRSCATCHKSDPMLPSKHAVTGKKIDPLSPKVQRDRFTKAAKVEKWFRRNCKWTLERECTSL